MAGCCNRDKQKFDGTEGRCSRVTSATWAGWGCGPARDSPGLLNPTFQGLKHESRMLGARCEAWPGVQERALLYSTGWSHMIDCLLYGIAS